MRKLIGLLCLLSLTCSAQFVSLRNFDTNYFHTNTLPVPANQWLISLNTNNSIFSGGSDLWTNDSIGLATVIRPVDKARSLWHDQTTSNYFGIIVQNLNTNGDTFTLGGSLVGLSTNFAAEAIYYQDGLFGGVFEASGDPGEIKAGSAVGSLGIATSAASAQYGAGGTAVAKYNNQTNVGVAGSALSNGKAGTVRVGGFFQNSTATQSGATDPLMVSSVLLLDNVDSSDSLLIGRNNGTKAVEVGPDGDFDMIKSLTYSWPTARGPANSVLTDVAANGTLTWGNMSGFINGSTNYIAKFTPNTNTVGDSILLNVATNQVDWRSRPSGTSYTNFMTNRFITTYTSEANYHALDLVAAPAAANGFHELHAVNGASGQTEGNPPLKLMDSLVIEPASARSGHTAYNVYPAASDSGLLGTTSVPFNGATFGSGNLTFTANTTVKPTILQTVGNYGIDFGLNHLSFYRNTGVTTSLNLERNSGTVQWDFAGNLLGFGAGMSNTHAFLQNSGTAGIIGVGTNNSAATPLRVGFMAQPANGTDRGGAQFVILGGAGTGTGRGGNIAFGTAMPTSTSSSVNTYRTNFFIAANPVTLTESSATTVCNISLGNGQVMGVTITATTEALDGTDMQVVTETFSIAAAQKTGAITTSVSASSPMSTLTTSGTLTTAWTATDGTGMVSIKCNAVSSLTQTTLRVLGYQIVLHTDGSSVLTPQ